MSQLWLGAWEWFSDRYYGRTAYSEHHFCWVSAKKDRIIPQNDILSDAEAALLCKTFGVAVAGTYSTEQFGDEWLVEHIHLIDLEHERVGVHEHNVNWFEGDRIFNQGFGSDGTRGPIPPHQYQRLSRAGNLPWAGTWELISDEWGGLMIMTDTHYRYVMTLNERPHFEGSRREMSDADAAVLYHTFDAQAGSYSVSGSTFSRRPIVVKNPRDKEHEIKADFFLEGNKLSLNLNLQKQEWQRIQ